MPGGVIDRRGVTLALNTGMAEGFRPSIDPDDLQHVADATPLSRTVVSRPQRRHIWLTVPSGYLLIICLFLPSLKLCSSGEPLPMVMIPFMWPPYVAGVLIALAAAARGEAVRGYGSALFMLIRISAFGLGGSLLFEMIDGQLGAEALIVVGLAVLAFMATWREPTERAVAAISAMAATGTFALTLAIALERFAVWGAYVGVIAAGVLLAGTLAWCLEVIVRPTGR